MGSTFDSLLHGFSVAMQLDNAWYAFLGCVVGTLVGNLKRQAERVRVLLKLLSGEVPVSIGRRDLMRAGESNAATSNARHTAGHQATV